MGYRRPARLFKGPPHQATSPTIGKIVVDAGQVSGHDARQRWRTRSTLRISTNGATGVLTVRQRSIEAADPGFLDHSPVAAPRTAGRRETPRSGTVMAPYQRPR